MADLERDGCRSLPGSDYAGGKPFCFYEGNANTPVEDWKWEECDIPVCEETCDRPGVGQDTDLPACEEYVEDNPELQASVSLFSGGGVGVGDNLEYLDDDLVKSTCRADGRLLEIGYPLMVSPLQLQRMAAKCHPSFPHSCAGEIWSGFSIISQNYFGVVLVAENTVEENVGLPMIGLDSFPAAGCHLAYMRDLSQAYLMGSCGRPEISLPYQADNQFMILYTSTVMEMVEGMVKIVLLGERSKIGVVSPARILDMAVKDDTISLVLAGSEGERVAMGWVFWVEDFDIYQVLDTECSIGNSSETKMVVKVVDNGNNVTLEHECNTL